MASHRTREEEQERNALQKEAISAKYSALVTASQPANQQTISKKANEQANKRTSERGIRQRG